MKVILREDVPELGLAGQTVEVKAGYGRNYLFPRNLAIPASKANLRAIDEIRKQKDLADRKRLREAEVIKERIEKLEVSTEVLVGEDEKLFGSVTASDVAALLEKENVIVDKRAVQLENPIKVLGVYTVPIKIDKEVTANLKLWVIKKS
ncbi:MAG: 50S ribosomal protein L9 [Candidatus Zixiibacteriota bacterium]|nr:MAG: 50S ribosomal protein L9 [candidate division Zixibacteria bacterium]